MAMIWFPEALWTEIYSTLIFIHTKHNALKKLYIKALGFASSSPTPIKKGVGESLELQLLLEIKQGNKTLQQILFPEVRRWRFPADVIPPHQTPDRGPRIKYPVLPAAFPWQGGKGWGPSACQHWKLLSGGRLPLWLMRPQNLHRMELPSELTAKELLVRNCITSVSPPCFTLMHQHMHTHMLTHIHGAEESKSKKNRNISFQFMDSKIMFHASNQIILRLEEASMDLGHLEDVKCHQVRECWAKNSWEKLLPHSQCVWTVLLESSECTLYTCCYHSLFSHGQPCRPPHSPICGSSLYVFLCKLFIMCQVDSISPTWIIFPLHSCTFSKKGS